MEWLYAAIGLLLIGFVVAVLLLAEDGEERGYYTTDSIEYGLSWVVVGSALYAAFAHLTLIQNELPEVFHNSAPVSLVWFIVIASLWLWLHWRALTRTHEDTPL